MGIYCQWKVTECLPGLNAGNFVLLPRATRRISGCGNWTRTVAMGQIEDEVCTLSWHGGGRRQATVGFFLLPACPAAPALETADFSLHFLRAGRIRWKSSWICSYVHFIVCKGVGTYLFCFFPALDAYFVFSVLSSVFTSTLSSSSVMFWT